MLLPTIFLHWQDYQRNILDRLKMLESSQVISGDGRHDSMGHSAKYGAYTIFSCTSQQITHFSLIQRNEVSSSTAMEYEGFKRSMDTSWVTDWIYQPLCQIGIRQLQSI